MQWDKDELKYEKYLVMDAIIKFSQHVKGRFDYEISIKELSEFIDNFFAQWKKY